MVSLLALNHREQKRIHNQPDPKPKSAQTSRIHGRGTLFSVRKRLVTMICIVPTEGLR